MLNCLSVGAPGQAARPRKRGGDGYNDWPTESDDAPRERGGDSLPIHRFRQFVALARPRKRGGDSLPIHRFRQFVAEVRPWECGGDSQPIDSDNSWLWRAPASVVVVVRIAPCRAKSRPTGWWVGQSKPTTKRPQRWFVVLWDARHGAESGKRRLILAVDRALRRHSQGSSHPRRPSSQNRGR